MVEYRTMKIEEIEDWFDHCAMVFGNDESRLCWRNKFVDWWYNDPYSIPDNTFLAVEDGKILSSVTVFIREIYLEGKIISCGGIGYVATKPEARGKGLAGQLIKNAVTFMENKKIKISLLATELPEYYKKFGWHQLATHYKRLQYVNSGNHCTNKHFANIRKVDFESDAAGISKIYEVYSGSLNGVIVRNNINYWVKWIKSIPGDWLALCDDTGKICAYVHYSMDKSTLTIREFGTLLRDINIDCFTNYICSVNSLKKIEVICCNMLNTSFPVIDRFTKAHIMIKLILPLPLSSCEVESTSELINAALSNENNSFIFWENDIF